MDQLGVQIVGTFFPKDGEHTLSHITLLFFPTWYRNHPFIGGSWTPKVRTPRYRLMQRVVYKVLTPQVAEKRPIGTR